MSLVTGQKLQLHLVWVVLLLGSLTAFGPLSMDMYLPALPTIAQDLNTTTSLAQMSLTACLVGLAVGQLIFGPLSDIQGRRKPLISTLIVYAIASVCIAWVSSIWLFIGLRFIQGVSGAAGIVIARASARDMYAGKELTKFIALLALVNGAAPILAPIIGGAILTVASWRTVFYTLSAIGMIMFVAVSFFFPETLPSEKRAQGGMFNVISTFSRLLKDPLFMGIACTQALISSSMFAYIAGSPFVLQNIYEVTPQQFSFFFAVNGLGIIIAAQVTARLSSHVDEVNLLFSGVFISFTGSLLLVIVVWQDLPLTIMAFALFLIVSSLGIVSTTCFSLGMDAQGDVAGSASAFLGLLPFLGGGIVSPLVGIRGDMTAWPMGIVILFCSTSALIIYLRFVRPTTRGTRLVA